VRLGVHLVNFTLPDGPRSIGAAIAEVGRASEESGVDNLSLMVH